MSETDVVTVYEMSAEVQHFEIAFGTTSTARLYVESFHDGRGRRQCTCRLHFDDDVTDTERARVVQAVKQSVLDHLPPGLCMVYVGKLKTTLDVGTERHPS